MNTAEPGHRPAQRILIIKPSSLGDIVHALPVLAALRAGHPRAHIAWLVGATFVPLLAGHPLLDEVIPFDRRRYGRMLQSPRILRDFLQFLGALRRRRFDLVIDLQGLFRSGFLAWVSGATERVGFLDARELAPLFYSQRVSGPDGDRHAVENNLDLAAALGLNARVARFPLGLRPAESQAAKALLREATGRPLERFTAILPGGRWPSKLWRPERLAELVDRLHADGHPPCVLLGAPHDRDFTDRITASCTTEVVDLVGRTNLRELVALLDLAERVVCHDSGPMHIAAALDKPLVALFGPTNPARTGPYSAAARVVRLPLECSPCYRRNCPLGHQACLQQLEVQAVLEEFRRLPAAADSKVARIPASRGTRS